MTDLVYRGAPIRSSVKLYAEAIPAAPASRVAVSTARPFSTVMFELRPGHAYGTSTGVRTPIAASLLHRGFERGEWASVPLYAALVAGELRHIPEFGPQHDKYVVGYMRAGGIAASMLLGTVEFRDAPFARSIFDALESQLRLRQRDFYAVAAPLRFSPEWEIGPGGAAADDRRVVAACLTQSPACESYFFNPLRGTECPRPLNGAAISR